MWLEVKSWSVVRVDGNYADARFCIDMKVILELKYVKINSIGYPFCCSSWIIESREKKPENARNQDLPRPISNPTRTPCNSNSFPIPLNQFGLKENQHLPGSTTWGCEAAKSS
jgi:hypothetical protein